MIAPLWRGVDRVVIACTAHEPALSRRLCAEAMANVARDTPWPVAGEDMSGPPARGDAVLRLQLVDSVLLVSIERGVVVDESEGALSARPVELTDSSDAALRAAVEHALDAALPWRRVTEEFSRSRRS